MNDIDAPKRHSLFDRLTTDSRYLLVSFPLAIAGFVVAVVGVVLGISTAIIWIGVPILAAILVAGRGFSAAQRFLVRGVTYSEIPSVSYTTAPRGAGKIRTLVQPIFDGQSWLNILWMFLVFPISIVTFVLTVTWWAGVIAGFTWPLWGWIIINTAGPSGIEYATEWLGWGTSYLAQSTLYVIGGLFFAVTLPFVVRGCAAAQGELSRALLTATSQLTQRIDDLSASRSAAQSAENEALRRIERDIHDGPQQQLVSLGMELSRARRQMDRDPDAAREALDEAIGQTRTTIDELRSLSRGIAPPILTDKGLTAAIEALAARSPIPVELDVALWDRRYPQQSENTIYFATAEALTNAAKHSHASQLVITLRSTRTAISVCVADNGVGGASTGKGHGLAGLTERVKSVEGQISIDSPEGGPTVIVAEVPCE
ncbi:sensor histidine kinase [Haloglycomyces albus]|uniref:sensor histidine kinase n=1 Tax=Haloglycomyces albus TaxID=526067 RepID=UPI00046CE85A|nr:sensor histidine kinase [Haloglycomyces albus]